MLAAKYQGLVCNEIQRILRDVTKNIAAAPQTSPAVPPAGDATAMPARSMPEERHRFSTSISFQAPLNTPQGHNPQHAHHRRIISEATTEGGSHGSISIPSSSDRSRSRPRQVLNEFEADAMARGVSSMSVDSPNAPQATPNIRRSSLSNIDLRAADSFEMELATRGSLAASSTEVHQLTDFSRLEYPNNLPIADFVTEVAVLVNRPPEKANEWTVVLKSQDVLTVGDLRGLQDEDWALLNLTVFAARAIKNVLRGARTRTALELLSPRETGRIPDPPFASTAPVSQTPTVTSSSNPSAHAAPIHAPIIAPSSSLTFTTANAFENTPNP